MRRFYDFYSGRVGAALLLIRAVVGLAFIFHGWPKIGDPAAFAGAVGLPLWLAVTAAWVEVIGGALLLLGLLAPVAALLLAAQMIGAFVVVHLPSNHPFVSSRGGSYELALTYLVINIGFLLTGPGAYSLDAFLMRQTDPTTAPAPKRRRGTV